MRRSISLVSFLAIITLLAFGSWLVNNDAASAGQGKGGEVVAKPTPTPAPKKPASNRPKTGSRTPRSNTAVDELAFWETIKNSTDANDFKAYLEQYPKGKFVTLAKNRLKALEAAKSSTNQTSTNPSSTKPNATPVEPAPAKPEPKPGTVVKNQIGIDLVYVPAGSFMMGSENGDPEEKPVHQVTIREGFYVGRYEVTQAQWQRVMGTNPSNFKGDNLPVEQVSWLDAQEFIRKLNEMKEGYAYRLPTESEWEYACRAGTTGDFAGSLDSMAWYANNSGRQYIDADAILKANLYTYSDRIADNGDQTHPVGQKQANAFGLYDMHGNVLEWCQDLYHDSYNGAPTDGGAWESGGTQDKRVLRGGSWDYFAKLCRSAARSGGSSSGGISRIGFRVVAVARPQ